METFIVGMSIVVLVVVWALLRSAKRHSGEPSEADRAAERERDSAPLVAAEQAARRAICLAAVVMRSQYELVMKIPEERSDLEPEAIDTLLGEHRRFTTELNKWLRDEGLWEHLSAKERGLMSKEAGSWTRDDCADASWFLESGGVIAWSVGLLDAVPAYDQSFHETAFIRAARLHKPVSETLKRAWLRSEEDIRGARGAAELWMWRARTTILMREPDKYKPPADLTFDQVISMTVEGAEKEGLFMAAGGDFPAFGTAYRDLSHEQWLEMHGIAYERLRGLNWVCGYEPDWDKVPCDT